MRSLSEIDRDMAGMTKRCKYRISIACYSGTCTYPSCDCPRPPSARELGEAEYQSWFQRASSDKITIRYERVGRCFWHIGCKAQRHAPPMFIGQDDQEKRRTVIRCTACNEAGFYPHGSVGDVCCERVPDGVMEGRNGD